MHTHRGCDQEDVPSIFLYAENAPHVSRQHQLWVGCVSGALLLFSSEQHHREHSKRASVWTLLCPACSSEHAGEKLFPVVLSCTCAFLVLAQGKRWEGESLRREIPSF